MSTLFEDLSLGMDLAVLELVADKPTTFLLKSGNNGWIEDLLPHCSSSEPFEIGDDLPYLEDFLIDAETVWSASAPGRIKSGLWTESLADRRDLNLEAIAIRQNDHQLLVIRNSSEEFAYRQRTLQSARELMIANDKLMEQHEYLHTRLLSILSKPKDAAEALAPLSSAIENAGFAVIILDHQRQPVIENSAVIELFEQYDNSYHKQPRPSEIILKLMRSQLPEYDRIFETSSSWSGELCWINPPHTLKWLKTAIYPVKSEPHGIKNWVIFISDISNIKHLLQRNEQLAMEDMLTQLPNRHAFWQTLEQRISQQRSFFLLYIDINEFRHLNEFYGHEEGDKLLVELGGRLQSALKKDDFIARVGGDEFAIILNDIESEPPCRQVTNRLLNLVEKPFISAQSNSYNVTLSIGAAGYPKDAQSVEELMKFVDLSAYNGRRNRQSTVQFYSHEMKEASRRRIQMEVELRHAILDKQFELHLQPILDLEDRRIIKAEALIRWNHPEHGMISPAEFIPVAEQSELIVALGRWVFEQTCSYSRQLQDNGTPLKISFNLSPVQIRDPELFSFIKSTIDKWQVDASLLELEITEGVLVDDYAKVLQLLNDIKALGITISVDDFGTGYSSLAYLKNLPLDHVKIDRSFVQDIVTDDNDKAIVLAVIAMAHNLNLSVIAEGVETNEQRDFLIDSQCNSAQGYLFSRPVPYEQLRSLL